MKLRTLGLANISLAAFLTLSSAHAANLCEQSFFPELKKSKHEIGLFSNVSPERQEQIGRIYQDDMTRGGGSTAKPPTGAVRRVEDKDLASDLETLPPSRMTQLREAGRKSISRLYVVTSGAGLWSRGAGQVKAVVPFNLGKLLPAAEIARLEKLSTIATASKPEDVLAKAGIDPATTADVTKTAEQLVIKSKAEIETILSAARSDKRALTPLDLKLVNVALSSARAKTYIPFDVWTSEQTHQVIIDYLASFKSNFKEKTFHTDRATDYKIKVALARYIEASERRGETHVLGIQAGVKALDPVTGEAVESSVAIGEGAGMLKHYLDASGRTRELRAMGKDTLLFDNIEVISDLEPVLAAHLQTGKDVSVVLVPQKQGYSGGSPFLVQKADGSWNLELHEQSALPAELASGNGRFNSNTLIYPLGLKPPYELGYEQKSDRGRKIVRVKMNAGDITKAASTAGIGGRIGIDYENFKSYQEFNSLGARLIDTYQGIWATLVGE